MLRAVALSISVSLLCALPASSSASDTWVLQSRRDFTSGNTPNSVALEDLNSDGAPDLIVGCSDGLWVRMGGAEGRFDGNMSFNTENYAYWVATGDLDGDGNQDVVTANRATADVSVLLGRGDGTFDPGVEYGVGSLPSCVAISDLDDDGAPDLVVSNESGNSISVLLGHGNGTFGNDTVYSVGYSPTSVAVGDLNGDGVPDVAVANKGDTRVSVLIGNGNGSLAPEVQYPCGIGPTSVAIADLDGDTIPDLTTCNWSQSNVVVILGNGDGSFDYPSYFDVGLQPYSIVADDLTNDGIIDVLVTNSDDDDFSLLEGVGNGTFGSRTDYVAGLSPWAAAVADLNGDGLNEVAIANRMSDDVSVYMGSAEGGFAVCDQFAAGQEPIALTLADFDSDGSLDLAVANSRDDDVSVLLGNGDGTFGTRYDYAAGDGPRSVAACYLDNDSDLDMVVVSTYSSRAFVFLGNGNGTFSGPTQHTTGASPRSVAPCDVNNDGDIDLVAACTSASSVSVLLGNGNGGFGTHTPFTTGAGPQSVAAADLNGDGDVDLAVACGSANSVSVLLGNGDGTFATHSQYGVGVLPSAVAIEDLDGDGILDIAAANGSSSSNSVSVLLGNGNGTFSPSTEYDVGRQAYDVAIEDFDGDGVFDLAVPRGSIRSVALLPGNGDGSFASHVGYGTGVGPSAVTTGDVNGDGIRDLVSANSESDDVSVLLGLIGSAGQDPPPAVPTGLAAVSGPSEGEISVSWNANGEPDFNHYELHRSTSSSFSGYSTFSTSSTSRLDTGLTPGTRYYYRLIAVDDGGNESSPSSSVSALAYEGGSGGVAAPTGVAATPGVVEGGILVSWDANGEPDLDHYRVERDDSPAFDAGTVSFDTPSTSYQDSGLTPGLTYYYRVIAVTTSDESDPSATVSAEPLDTAPAAPTGLVATSGPSEGQISVSWNANGEPDLDYYRLHRSTSPSFTGYSSFITTSTSRLDSGLTPGTTYYYRVFAVDDGANQSNASATASAVAYEGGSGGVAAPTGVAATPGVGEGGILVSWDANSEPDLDHYRVERDDSPAFDAGTVSFDTPSTSYQDTGLTLGVTYYYRVIAVTTSDESDPSATVSAQPLGGAPAAPTGLVATPGPSEGQITVSWDANDEPDLDYYKLQRSTSPTFTGYSSFITTSTSRLDYGLTPGTTYYYRVYAVDDGGNQSDPSPTVSAVAYEGGSGSVAAPTGVVAIPGPEEEGGILVAWDANSEPDLDHYRVERDDAPTFGAGTVTFDTPLTYYQDTGLTLGVTYYYRVIAVTTADESNPSATVSAEPLDTAPAVPTGLTAVPGAENGQISVSWNANGEPDFNYYKLQRSTSPTFSGGYSTINTSATSRLDTGLTPGTTYYYRIYAVDDASNMSAASATISAEATDTGAEPLAAPTGVTASPGATEGAAQVSWNANSEPGLDHYRVERDDAQVFGGSTESFNTTSTSFTDSGLTPGRTYYYRVIAVGTYSESDPSETASASLPDYTPTVPTGLTAGPGSAPGEMLVTWDPNSQPDIDHYVLERSANGNFGGNAVSFTTPASYFTDSDLTAGRTYYYRVCAVDAAGNESAACAVVTGDAQSSGDVAAPLGVTASSGPGEGEILVSWDPNSEPDLSYYRVERDVAPEFGAGTVTFNTPSTSFQDDGLVPSQTYYYRVVAVTTSSESGPSAAVAADALDMAPTTPSGLVANVGQHDGEIEVSWNPIGDIDLDYYRLERSTSSNFLLGRVDVDTTSTSHMDSGLTPGETYYYRVVAVDAGDNESGPSSTGSATALDLAPAAPVNLVVVSGPGDGEATVTWDENIEIDMYRYEVQRDIYEMFTHSPVIFSVFGTSLIDSGLEAGVTYYYRVFAIDVAGNVSDPSEVVEITLPSGTAVPEDEYRGPSFSLAGPNPSSTGDVAFAFSVPAGGADVTIDLYDVSGRLVRSVVDRPYRGGVYEAHWDGRSRGGGQVGSGVYFCLTRIGEWTNRSKVLIAR